MKIVENILAELLNTENLLDSLQQEIAELDHDYTEELAAYHCGVEKLTQEVTGAEEYLAAMRQELESNVRYALWLGFQWNVECFHNPVNKLLLNMDFEDICQESRMHTLPETQIAQQRINTFLRSLPNDKAELLNPIVDYDAYLKTYAYKLAHYAGFCLADKLLPNLMPGYITDPALTMCYAQQIEMALGELAG